MLVTLSGAIRELLKDQMAQVAELSHFAWQLVQVWMLSCASSFTGVTPLIWYQRQGPVRSAPGQAGG